MRGWRRRPPSLRSRSLLLLLALRGSAGPGTVAVAALPFDVDADRLADGAAEPLREAGEGADRSPRAIGVDVLAIVDGRDGEDAQELSERRPQLGTRHDGVHEAVREEELRCLEALRHLLPHGVGGHARAGEADERLRLGEHDVPDAREAGEDPAGRRI